MSKIANVSTVGSAGIQPMEL